MLAVAPVGQVGKDHRGVSGCLASKSPDTALGHTHSLPMFKPAEGDIDTGEAQGTSLQHSQAQLEYKLSTLKSQLAEAEASRT